MLQFFGEKNIVYMTVPEIWKSKYKGDKGDDVTYADVYDLIWQHNVEPALVDDKGVLYYPVQKYKDNFRVLGRLVDGDGYGAKF